MSYPAENPILQIGFRPHVFLTGDLQCGKTTIIRTILAKLPKTYCLAGFSTFFVQQNAQSDVQAETKYLYIADINSPPRTDSANEMKNHRLVVERSNKKTTIYTENFNTYAVKLIQNKPANIIIMDECGRFESDCETFKQAVFSCLQEDIPILGTVRKLHYPSWLDDIKNHQNVLLIDVHKKNISEIIEALFAWLKNRYTE
ncbi:MAG: nucleoside-triphosphatase [Spirochaetales bacterium]